MIKKIICLILLCFCFSCSNSNNDKKIDIDNNLLSEPENLYKLAKITFDNENFELARNQFQEIQKLFPLSNEAIQSEIMIAFIEYVRMNYDNAIINYQKIINRGFMITLPETILKFSIDGYFAAYLEKIR